MRSVQILSLLVVSIMPLAFSFHLNDLVTKKCTFLRQTDSSSFETPLDMASEETLLKIHMEIQEGKDSQIALEKVTFYTQTFPFAAVLPVQPLQYLPTHDGGVDVLFLRKKTKEKGSIDGGLRFFVLPSSGGGIEVEVKRNSKGQSISKAFSEKLVVQAYCDGIMGKNDLESSKPLLEFISVSSVFHKWL